MNSSGADLSDYSMLDLFRSEVETHVSTLNDGLLALEGNPSALDNIESLMRAAHSIKGGARIVEVDAAVKLAHTMEDCFVAAQKREIVLKPESIDVLLKGVDMLSRIAEAVGQGFENWLLSRQDEINRLIGFMSAIRSGAKPDSSDEIPHVHLEPPAATVDSETPPKAVAAEAPAESESSKAIREDNRQKPEKDRGNSHPVEPVTAENLTVNPKSEAIGPEAARVLEVYEEPSVPEIDRSVSQRKLPEKDRMMRVTAGKVERLMGLAGEVVLSSRWLPPFSKSFMILKKEHRELNLLLERLQKQIEQSYSISEDALSTPLRKRELYKSDVEKTAIRDMVIRAREKVKECNQYLLDRMNRLEVFTGSVETLSDRLYHEIVGVRMCPFADGIRGLPRMVRDIARKLGKKVRLIIIGESTDVDRDILEKLDAPLIHLLRNALDHGIEPPEERKRIGKPETGTLKVEAAHRSGILMITISDDGRGIDIDSLRNRIISRGLADSDMVSRLSEAEVLEFLFLPGFSTIDHVTEVSGRGVGLDVVHTMVHAVGGVVRAVSKPGKGMSFHLELPLTLSVLRTFLVEISKEPYAFPLARIDRCLMVSRNDIQTVEDREYFRHDNRNISLVDIHDVLQLDKPPNENEVLPIVVISDRLHSYGIAVDKFLGEYDLVIRPLDARLGKVPGISAASVMLDGSPVLIFDIEDMVRLIDNLLTGKRFQKIGPAVEAKEVKAGKHILVVDDSITVREMERKLLENKGYIVETAVDGMDAWNLLRTAPFEMVVSDIDMPRMNGIELITQMKQHERLKNLPVMIVSYKNKEEDRIKGLEAGANYYLTKSSFQDDSFINAVVDLIGEA